MTGRRVYLDWNASAPLRPEARAAMLVAMDTVGNPSSVHAEGRAARAIVERARGQVAALVGCAPAEVVFTSGATEAASIVLGGAQVHCGDTEHECVLKHRGEGFRLPVGNAGNILSLDPNSSSNQEICLELAFDNFDGTIAIQSANGEVGTLNDIREFGGTLNVYCTWKTFSDITQTVGKQEFSCSRSEFGSHAFSSHKIGGPKGVGTLQLNKWWNYGLRQPPLGGGQEGGRRSGTENVVGIAGFGAAAEAARRDLEAGVWGRVERLRDALEERLESAAPDLILVGKGAARLPNTSCFAVPGWAGETQVMQMDLAGFAVSAGSACSSGKVKKASRVLLAMGFDETTASSAIRVSLGPVTTEAEVMAFADAWIERYRRRNSRAA